MRHAQTGDRQLTQLSTYHFTYLRFSRASCSGAVLAGQLLVWQNAGVHISRPVLPPESPATAFTPQGKKEPFPPNMPKAIGATGVSVQTRPKMFVLYTSCLTPGEQDVDGTEVFLGVVV